jgi:hypothetical protein
VNPVTHQTIRLSSGKHSSPEKGACVVELASMLAGEPFSDHPRSVCPVIAALLRRCNDYLDDHRRQDLYPYAAKVVGSRGTPKLEHTRIKYLNDRVPERPRHRWPRVLGWADPSLDVLAHRVVHELANHGEESHRLILWLVDELLALDTGPTARVPTTLPAVASGPGSRAKARA